jgi:hypothetical protein
VPAGESDGDSSELMSMVCAVDKLVLLFLLRSDCTTAAEGTRALDVFQSGLFYNRELQEVQGIESLVTSGMGRRRAAGAKGRVGGAGRWG